MACQHSPPRGDGWTDGRTLPPCLPAFAFRRWSRTRLLSPEPMPVTPTKLSNNNRKGRKATGMSGANQNSKPSSPPPLSRVAAIPTSTHQECGVYFRHVPRPLPKEFESSRGQTLFSARAAEVAVKTHHRASSHFQWQGLGEFRCLEGPRETFALSSWR